LKYICYIRSPSRQLTFSRVRGSTREAPASCRRKISRSLTGSSVAGKSVPRTTARTRINGLRPFQYVPRVVSNCPWTAVRSFPKLFPVLPKAAGTAVIHAGLEWCTFFLTELAVYFSDDAEPARTFRRINFGSHGGGRLGIGAVEGSADCRSPRKNRK